jgi:hypothetical protein
VADVALPLAGGIQFGMTLTAAFERGIDIESVT